MEKRGYVYFIGDSNHTGIKIGFSKKPQRRLHELQIANSSKLEILYLIPNASKNTETFYHNYLSSYLQLSGEWYEYDYVSKWIKYDKKQKKVLREEGLIK